MLCYNIAENIRKEGDKEMNKKRGKKRKRRWSTRAKEPKIVKCPVCGKEVKRQGLGGHLFIMHHIRSSKDYRIRQLEEEIGKLKQQIEELSGYQRDYYKLSTEYESLKEKYDALSEKLHNEVWKDIKNWKCEKCGITFEKYSKEGFIPEFHIKWDEKNKKIQVRCWRCSF